MTNKLQRTIFYAGFLIIAVVLITLNANAQCILPAKPASITATGGNTKVCPGSTKTYTSASVAGATSYNWTAPAGGNIVSGQGSLTVTINYTSGFVGNDSLKVAAVNSCGTGLQRAILISRNNPPTTGAFTGPATGFCGMSGVNYSVPNISGVTFNWSFDVPGATITSGQGTHAITANFTTSFNMGILGVSTSNACGVSGEHHLHLKASPVAATSINGPTSVCTNQQGVSYSIAAIPTANTYTWTGPSGSHLSDGNTTSSGNTLTTTATSITINYGANAGSVKVRGNNACGTGSTKSVTVTMTCRESKFEVNDYFNINIYPVPAKNELNISFYSNEEQTNSIRIFNILGINVFKQDNYSSAGKNNFVIDLSTIASGLYFVEVTKGKKSAVQKIIVE